MRNLEAAIAERDLNGKSNNAEHKNEFKNGNEDNDEKRLTIAREGGTQDSDIGGLHQKTTPSSASGKTSSPRTRPP